ncbi:hypothetical protein ACLB2K_030324 [Fragaria x ananassa]
MENGSDSSSLVYLNVGGKKFYTSIDTLTRLEPDSMLATMFSGRHTLFQDREAGYTFIDRDGKYFGYILNWLRDGDVPILEDRKSEVSTTPEGGTILTTPRLDRWNF